MRYAWKIIKEDGSLIEGVNSCPDMASMLDLLKDMHNAKEVPVIYVEQLSDDGEDFLLVNG